MRSFLLLLFLTIVVRCARYAVSGRRVFTHRNPLPTRCAPLPVRLEKSSVVSASAPYHSCFDRSEPGGSGDHDLGECDGNPLETRWKGGYVEAQRVV